MKKSYLKVALIGLAVFGSTNANAFFKDLIDGAKDVVEDVKDFAEDAYEDTRDFFEDAGDKVSNVASEGFGVFQGFVESIGNTDGDALIRDPKITEYVNESWEARAWALQRSLSLHYPMSQTNEIGTHNSYNSEVYRTATRYLDPQHFHSTYDQLRLGARYIEYDAHWTTKAHSPTNIETRLLLCHSGFGAEIGNLDLGCSITDRTLRAGLFEIRRWLDEPREQE